VGLAIPGGTAQGPPPDGRSEGIEPAGAGTAEGERLYTGGVRCSECGELSRDGSGLREYHPGVGEAPLRFCAACWARREVRAQRLGFWFALVVVVGGLALGSILPIGDDARVARLGLLLVVAFAASVVLHELGHAVAGQLLGLPPLQVRLGFGVPLWTFRLAGVDWELSGIPLAGFVRLPSGGRGRDLLVYAAGPAVNAALLAGAWWLADRAAPPGAGLDAITGWHAVALANAIYLVMNLAPFELRSLHDGPDAPAQTTDGLAILRLLAGGRPAGQ